MSHQMSTASSQAPEETSAALPRSSAVVKAFSHAAEVTARHPVLAAAAKLALEHWMRAEAHRLVHNLHADDRMIASAARTIAARDAGCAVLMEQIDAWAATLVGPLRTSMLHSESLGQLISRLCIAWTRWRLLSIEGHPAAVPGAESALDQLTELCTAYDDLIADLRGGRRHLPVHQTSTGLYVAA
ncbi:DUF4254 domain-containing protein [Lentzea sp. NPDC102401]|uniref:DUF4254 domain-containing protein n=1 Tax=Lentzea sp. NPDC102401 TaxID=3364128 RepID=UPI003806F772